MCFYGINLENMFIMIGMYAILPDDREPLERV